MFKTIVTFLLLVNSLVSSASERTLIELDTEAEVTAWYVACKSVSSNNKEMTDMAITFDESFNLKKDEINKYPENQRKYVIAQAKNKSLELVKQRFIVASCKDLYTMINSIQSYE